MTSSEAGAVTTARLLVRPPREADRERFVELFCSRDFMAFYPEVFTEEQAGKRFDHMVAVCQTIPFGKQPVVELSSGVVVGYTGVDYIEVEGSDLAGVGIPAGAGVQGPRVRHRGQPGAAGHCAPDVRG